ncbi:hypothetical protein [Planktotalea sp.]|uniref:hypothetical protein n=1 Tax=Planktotalea sp. TaxID=2029877 RepID=UPI0032997219
MSKSKDLSAFTPVAGFEGIYTAQKGNLRCTAVKLATGGVCLYSPVLGLGPVAMESLGKIGKVTHLLAPNHYHHKGLGEFHTAFPEAILCCSAAAKPRLEKQTSLSFTSLEEVPLPLAGGWDVLEPKGLKTGEIWMQSSTTDSTLWIVTDAFCGAKAPIGAVVEHPELLGTFPKFGVKDRAEYLAWLTQTLQNKAPTTIAPCHGALVSGANVGADALELISQI